MSRSSSNIVMLDGKKAVAEGIVYGAFDIVARALQGRPAEVFRKALDNVKPKLEVKSRRVGGATYQVPVEVRPGALASRSACAGSSSTPASAARRRCMERLADEFVDAAQNRGNAVKKREDIAQDGRGQQGLRALPLVSS